MSYQKEQNLNQTQEQKNNNNNKTMTTPQPRSAKNSSPPIRSKYYKDRGLLADRIRDTLGEMNDLSSHSCRLRQTTLAICLIRKSSMSSAGRYFLSSIVIVSDIATKHGVISALMIDNFTSRVGSWRLSLA
jgi:hypothetical protein